MKIHILYNFQDQPWGGGNQFLKALKREFEIQDIYEDKPENADVIIFNSHHNFDEVFDLKNRFKSKIFIHRIDGPLHLTRGSSKDLDKIIYKFNSLIADGIVFQSNWCRSHNHKFFKISTKYETVVSNASDKEVFNEQEKTFTPDKVKIIASGWSPNWRKGFEVYKYLDENLDFSRYGMTFVGNSPVEFKNIKYIKPVGSKELAGILRQHDIYITASQNDPCSNSLIEALSCGLPAVALNDGGHPELIGNGGELFVVKQEVIEKINKVAKNYNYYHSQIKKPSMEKVCQSYLEFVKKIYQDIESKSYKPKQLTLLSRVRFCMIKLMALKMAIKQKLC